MLISFLFKGNDIDMKFKIFNKFSPSGDQPQAIEKLSLGVKNDVKNQTLKGITGSGKTFTMANVIQNTGKPALIIAPNKTLAAQLYDEMKEFFPDNAVEYFVSYYDYYQPEAYIPRSDKYIEKDSSINEHIDLMRHSATRSLLERKDVIVVSSVSCIYGIGSPELYYNMTIKLEVGKNYSRQELLSNLIDLQYERNDISFERGNFRVRGDVIDIYPSHYDQKAWRLSFFGEELESVKEFDPITMDKIKQMHFAIIYANSHYVTPRDILEKAIIQIKDDLKERLFELRNDNKLLEAQRLEQRTEYDLEMLVTSGMCKGIENYSRYLSGAKKGHPPPTLFEYLPKDSILFIDESHVTVPQIGAMYNGDRARKEILVEYGFRLPSALDNRPLKFEEWEDMRPQTIYVSATPGKYELDTLNSDVVEQIIRPTGLLDPIIEIRKASLQVEDFISEAKKEIQKGNKILCTTLTKKMSEDLTDYLQSINYKAVYMHSEIKTIERIEIIRDLRKGIYDILIGINLLREGLDIPECSLVAILDGDKEGFLRSETSLIQTIGRAARNAEGRVIIYADVLTRSIKNAVSITERRRNLQEEYNSKNGIIPKTINRSLDSIISTDKIPDMMEEEKISSSEKIDEKISLVKKEMLKYASDLNFEKAAELRNQMIKLLKLRDKII